MKVSDIFMLHQGNGFELINMELDKRSGLHFVARTGENNGVVATIKVIDRIAPFPAGLLTVALGGSVLSSFVQHKPFYTGFHVMVLEPKKNMRLEEKLFYCHGIKMNAYRYRYGRQANKTLKDIPLPDMPDWLSTYHIDYSKISTTIEKKLLPLPIEQWKRFRIGDLFEVRGTKTTKIEDLEIYGKGKYPYITTKSSNNGVEGFYKYFTEPGKVLVIDSAVAGFCSYQDTNFTASDHVEKLIPCFPINKYIGLFIATVINLDRYRYNYGRKCNQKKIQDTYINLPVCDNESPDWNFMEQYIKSLSYSDKI